MRFTLSAVVLAAASLVAAQGTPDPSTISPCILGCVTPAATEAGCSSFADVGCICSSQPFQMAAQACLASTCTAEEQAAALQLQQTICGAASTGSSSSGAATSAAGSSASTSGGGAASPTATAPTGASPSPSTGAALSFGAPGNAVLVLGAIAALFI